MAPNLQFCISQSAPQWLSRGTPVAAATARLAATRRLCAAERGVEDGSGVVAVQPVVARGRGTCGVSRRCNRFAWRFSSRGSFLSMISAFRSRPTRLTCGVLGRKIASDATGLRTRRRGKAAVFSLLLWFFAVLPGGFLWHSAEAADPTGSHRREKRTRFCRNIPHFSPRDPVGWWLLVEVICRTRTLIPSTRLAPFSEGRRALRFADSASRLTTAVYRRANHPLHALPPRIVTYTRVYYKPKKWATVAGNAPRPFQAVAEFVRIQNLAARRGSPEFSRIQLRVQGAPRRACLSCLRSSHSR